MGTIGQRIKRLRDEKGLSMDAFGKAIGTDSANVSNWEKDRRVPGGKFLIEMSNYCGVSTDWILKGESRSDVEENRYDISPEEYDLIVKLRALDFDNQAEAVEIIERKYARLHKNSQPGQKRSTNSQHGANGEGAAARSETA
ncbi:helix-turn-helix domain-containing protein [Paenibacillus popilliae]|uniref:Predicted transcriptional regulator n=1 Tax=Paenibacillus popilliae ATCC 14706 TaxID=1212764 RepID=M9LFW5_PAEPP|nr:helix-turn-helix transcriptional regulator [Paenibacillus popilliae]GAC41290.1 predicted transcriptional regulator [Paenibacillus popilliae ATCC 14706]